MALRPGKLAPEQTPEIGAIRELTRADLSVLQEARPQNQIQTIRDTHHKVARAVAAGMKPGEVAAHCGLSYNRVWTLRNDPAFQELVAHYRGVITAAFVEEADPVIGYLRDNALKAQAQLSDKLDAALEEGTFLPTRDLVAIAELGLDRTGYGKVNKNLNVNVDFAARLEEMKTRSAKAPAMRTIDAQVVAAPPPLAPDETPRDTPSLTAEVVHPSVSRSVRRF